MPKYDVTSYDYWDLAACFVWNAIVILGTAYLVFWMDRSAWWFVLPCIFLWRTDKNKAMGD